jgi:hypothetical protein
MRVFEGTPLEIGSKDRLKPRLAELQAEMHRVQSLADGRMA